MFKLRKGVSFHDGKPLTPADVVFSMMRHKDAATASRAKVLADQIEDVTATGPNEVTFRAAGGPAGLDQRGRPALGRTREGHRHTRSSSPRTNLIMRFDRSPGTNPDCVLAMKHLFNREQMLKTIAQGYGVVANDQPIGPASRFHFKGLPQRAYDPEKAKRHLQGANLSSRSAACSRW